MMILFKSTGLNIDAEKQLDLKFLFISVFHQPFLHIEMHFDLRSLFYVSFKFKFFQTTLKP